MKYNIPKVATYWPQMQKIKKFKKKKKLSRRNRNRKILSLRERSQRNSQMKPLTFR